MINLQSLAAASQPAEFPSIMSVSINLIVAAVSLIIGSLINRWWTRARPLVLLKHFDVARRATEQVKWSNQDDELNLGSWLVPLAKELPPQASEGHVYLDHIQKIKEASYIACMIFEDALSKIEPFVEDLKSATTDDEIRSSLFNLMTCGGINTAVEMSLWNQQVVCSYQPKDPTSSRLAIDYIERKLGGTYEISWQSSTSPFCKHLAQNPEKHRRVEPFAHAMRELDKSELVRIFSTLPPLLRNQVEINRKILSRVDDILDKRTRWMAYTLVANYGESAMLIWPEAELRVRHRGKSGRGTFTVDAHLVIVEDDEANARLEGVHVLAPGEIANIWIVTNKVQQNIDGGDALRGHYKSGDSQGQISLKITRRGAAFGKVTKSNWNRFSERFSLASGPDDPQ